MSALVLAGATVYVPDASTRRVTLIDPRRLVVIETVPLPQRVVALQWAGTGSGTVLAGFLDLSGGHSVAAVRSGRFETLIRTPGLDPMSIPLLAGGPEHEFALADRQQGTVAIYARDGRSLATFRWTEPRMPITDAAREFIAASAGGYRQDRRRSRADLLTSLTPAGSRDRVREGLRQRVAGLMDAEYYPPFAGVRMDAGGNLWIARPLTVEAMRSAAWGVSWDDLKSLAASWEAYRPDGTHRMTVRVPYGFVLTDLRFPLLYGYRIMDDGLRWVTVLRVPADDVGR